jgi:hypothetical protein
VNPRDFTGGPYGFDWLGATTLALAGIVAAAAAWASARAVWHLACRWRRRRRDERERQARLARRLLFGYLKWRDDRTGDMTAVADATREPKALTDEQDEALYDLDVSTWNDPLERAVIRAVNDEMEARDG